MSNGIMGKFFYLLFLVVLLGLVGNASGAIKWNDDDPADHLWSSPDNWDLDRIPNSADSVIISGSKVCEIDASMTGANKAVGNALYGPGCYADPCTTILNIEGELSLVALFYIGHEADSTGVTNVSGSGDVNCGEFRVGNMADSNGTLDMTGGNVTAGDALDVGYYGDGTVNLNGGTLTAGDYLHCGLYFGSNGTLNIDGGILNVNGPRFTIAHEGNATVTMDSGTVNAVETVIVSNAAGTGSMTINGGTYNNTGKLTVGEYGTTGTLTMTNGNVTAGDHLDVGYYGDGTVNLNGGTLTANDYLHCGLYSGSNGTLNIDGGILNVNGPRFTIAHQGNATVTMDSGTVNAGETSIVSNAAGTGSMTINGGTYNNTGELLVGENAAGTLNVTGGSLITDGLLSLARSGSSTGDMNVTGGSVTANSNFYVGRWGTVGTLTISGGGTVTTTGDMRIGEGSSTSGSKVSVVNGGTLNVASGKQIRIGNNTGSYELYVSDANVNTGYLFIGAVGDSVGEVNMPSGNVYASTSIGLGQYGNAAGTLYITGGNVTTPGNLTVGASATAGPCYVKLYGGTISAGNLSSIKSNSNVDIEAGTLILDGDDRETVGGYIDSGLLTGYGNSRNVKVYYDGSDTIVTADVNLANCAWSPSPYYGEIIPGWDFNDVNLVWAPGDAAAKHRIYFGETFDEVNDANTSTAGIYKDEQNLDANEFDPGTLELGRSYYWRIDEVNGVDEWKGSVWTFRVQEYSLVDDFEPYAGTGQLQAVWGSNGTLETGPKVGGHDGNSMAVAYDNVASPYYTEATRDYGSDQDWTVAGLKSLELYFHGDKGNAADKIYVKLDDGSHSKAIYYDNPNAITEYWKWWQLWRIELADFSAGGVDLSKVRKIAIGVSQDPPAAGGGSGTIYVDDIRLYPTVCFVDDALSKGGLVGDCQEVDFDDLDEMVSDWLVSGVNVPAVAPATGPVAWYKFDETSDVNAYDSSGNDYTATVNQAGAWDTGGYYNGCLDFDGTVDVIAPAGTFSTIDKQITVSVWVNGNASVQPVTDLLLNATISGSSRCAVLYAYPMNELVCRASFHTSYQLSPEDQVHSGCLEPWQYAGQWNHYAFVKDADAGLQSIYLNGVLIAQEDGCFGSMAGVDTITIGNYSPGYPYRYFFGKMDDFRIYDYALSQAEIVSLSDQASAYQPVLSDADINYDDSVDFEDFAILAENWLTQPLWP